jgi:cytochrome P450
VSAPRPHAEVVRALDQIEGLVRANEAGRTAAAERGETLPLCALTELWRLRSDGLDEQTTLRNLIYLTETTGHDAAGVLMWLLKHLGDNPKWLQALRELGDEEDAPETLISSTDRDGAGQRGLANRIISETMRLEQSEFILRQTTTEIRFRGFVIPKGWAIRVCTQESHRDPELFPEPNRFNPDRFLNAATRDGDYAPFGLGDRSCTGASMTRALARTFICELADHYDLAVVADGPRTLSLHRHWAPSPTFQVSLMPRTAQSAR